MGIDVNFDNIDWSFKQANRYLPVKLSTIYLNGYGDCMIIVANRADSQFIDIVEGENSEYFVTLYNPVLHNQIKQKVLSMDYWTPDTHYNTFDGTIGGNHRKIHMDGSVF